MDSSYKTYRHLYNRLAPYHKLIHSSQAILAYSGGKDSNLVLGFYDYLTREKNIPTPILYHLNHRIRNNHTQEEEIRQFLESNPYPSIFRSSRIPELAVKLGKSWEETGRIVRFLHLRKIQSTQAPYSYIVTGHHSLDYLESLFIHWIRGGGKKALDTMPIWNGSVFRPLLELEDKELSELYRITEQRFKVWEDESNGDQKYLRNRIRSRLVSFLTEEGLDFHRLFTHLNSTNLTYDSLALHNTNRQIPRYLKIPHNTLRNTTYLGVWKSLLDSHLLILKLHPAKKTSLEEIFRLIQRNCVEQDKSFEFSTGEFYLWKQKGKDLILIPTQSGYFQKPQYHITEDRIIIQWNGESSIDKPGDPRETRIYVSPPSPGERIYIQGMHREISEILRVEGIPPKIRPFFPILRSNEKPIRILTELFNES